MIKLSKEEYTFNHDYIPRDPNDKYKGLPLTIVTVVFIMLVITLVAIIGMWFKNRSIISNQSFIDSCGIFTELKHGNWEFSETLTKEWETKINIKRDRFLGNNLEAFKNNENDILVFSTSRLSDKEVEKLRNYDSVKDMIKSFYPNGEFQRDLYKDFEIDTSIWIITQEDGIETWATIKDGYKFELRIISDKSTYEVLLRALWSPSSNIDYYNIEHDVNVEYDDWYDSSLEDIGLEDKE